MWMRTGTRAQSSVPYPDAGHDSCCDRGSESFWFDDRNRCIAALMARFPPDRSLLFAHFGGGNGYVAAMIQQLGYRTVLFEPGAKGTQHARTRGLTELMHASTMDLEIQPGSLDAIGLFDVLEHIEDASTALRNLRPALADGGRVYAIVPADMLLWSMIDEEAGHFRRYTRARLGELFRGCGFNIDLQFILFPAAATGNIPADPSRTSWLAPDHDATRPKDQPGTQAGQGSARQSARLRGKCTAQRPPHTLGRQLHRHGEQAARAQA